MNLDVKKRLANTSLSITNKNMCSYPISIITHRREKRYENLQEHDLQYGLPGGYEVHT